MTHLPPPTDYVLQRPAPQSVSDGVSDDIDEGGSKPTLRWTWIAVSVLAALVVIVAFWVLRNGADKTTYLTEPVTRGPLVVQVTATGTLQPTNQVEVGTEISGNIASVDVDYNDTVKVGQILARIDTTRLQAQAQLLRAAITAAEAKVLQTQATRDESGAQLARLVRMQEATNGTIPSESDIDAARAAFLRADADLANARALVRQSQATLDAQETDLRKAVIRSPIDGIVLQRSVEAGQTVAASLQAPVLFVLAEDLKQMELHVDTDEADVAVVKAGQAATFAVDAFPDRSFAATVKEVYFGSRTVNGVVTYETVLEVDNSGLELRPGMTATANIVVNRLDDVLLVPNAALRFEPLPHNETSSGGGLVSRLMPRMPMRGSVQRSPAAAGERRIWTLQTGQPVPLTVRTGATDGVRTAVVSGNLTPGMPIITDTKSTGS